MAASDKTLSIGSELFAQLVPWLEQAYPDEGCGLILENRAGEARFLECENVIDKYHQLDPESYPRTARDFYMIDPREFMRAEEREESVVAIVHSHPDTGDYFSDSDVEAALMPRDNEEDSVEPIYPGADYLVVSVLEGKATEASLYRFDNEDEKFGRADKWNASRLAEMVNHKEALPETVS